MLLAQISDTHITVPGKLLAGRVDSAGHLARAVAQLNALDPRPAGVLATGDLTDLGSSEEFRHLRALLAPLAMPVYAIPGNHDRRDSLRAAFSDQAWMRVEGPGGAIAYAFELGDLRVIALDTLIEGADEGRLGTEQLTWLDARLAQNRARPVLIMLHHPPVDSGIRVMDAMKLTDAEALGAVVGRHPQVERIVCGHLHRTMHMRWAGTTVSVCPSTADQLHLALERTAPLATVAEPPGLLLHYWDGRGPLITHAVAVGDYGEPVPCE